MSYFHYQCPSSRPHEKFFRYATGDEVRNAFRENKEELAWLALFLTANADLAEICMADACAVAAVPSDVCTEWLEGWTRCCTIRSAVEMQQLRIQQLASASERTSCAHLHHPPLSPVVLELLYEEPKEVGSSLDVLCRAAVVLIGIERYSPTESAEILGISRTAVEAAYWRAWAFFEILRCELLVGLGIGAEPGVAQSQLQ